MRDIDKAILSVGLSVCLSVTGSVCSFCIQQGKLILTGTCLHQGMFRFCCVRSRLIVQHLSKLWANIDLHVVKPQLATERLRLHASVMSMCLFVCLSVYMSPKCQKTLFSQKLSNLELRCLLKTIGSRTWAIQRTHHGTPKIPDGRDPPSWKSTWLIVFWRGWSDLDKISKNGKEWHVDCGDVWKWKPDV